MTLEEYTKKTNEINNYNEKRKPYDMEMILLEQGKIQAIRQIENEYNSLLKIKNQEMKENIGYAPVCNHDLLIVSDVLIGDYFDKQRIAYCPCCKSLIDGAFAYKSKYVVTNNSVLNEEEFSSLKQNVDSLIEKIYMDNPDFSLEEVSEFLNEELKVHTR